MPFILKFTLWSTWKKLKSLSLVVVFFIKNSDIKLKYSKGTLQIKSLTCNFGKFTEFKFSNKLEQGQQDKKPNAKWTVECLNYLVSCREITFETVEKWKTLLESAAH